MADEVKIDGQTFHNRLSSLISAWKADRRSSDALFAGVGSFIVLMGKNEDAGTYQKSNAMHVRLSEGRLQVGSLLRFLSPTVLATWV